MILNIEIKKEVIGSMERCYALASINTMSGKKIIVGSEAVGGECKIYSLEDYTEETIFKNIGGTMSIVPLNTKDEQQESFLISQKFYPGFQAKESKIVKLTKKEEHWVSEEVLVMPYLHRFDIIQNDGKDYIVCATLCTWKNEREDWSSPGHVFVGEYDRNNNTVKNLRIVLANITKNHGFIKVQENQQQTVIISSEDSVYKIFVEKDHYYYKNINGIPSSEITLVDINNDGEQEMVIIEEFHGKTLGVYDRKGELLTRINRDASFLHSLWSGSFAGQNIVICGARRGLSDLVLIYFNEKMDLQVVEIDSNVGSANIIVEEIENGLSIISANNLVNEVAAYSLFLT